MFLNNFIPSIITLLIQKEFELLLLLAHYLAARSAYMATPQLEKLVAKVSVSLLRYTHVLPADKAFYEAGMSCKVSVCVYLIYAYTQTVEIAYPEG